MAQQFNYLFLSDFHLSEGRNPANGLIHRNEDFFQDVPFAQFVVHHVKLSRRETAVEYYNIPWKLIINGDIFDFLQVVALPEGAELGRAKGEPNARLTANEQKYGLGTSELETAWKLEKIAEGHPCFFQALAWFVAQPGNELHLLKGNHDVELYWPEVQVRLRLLLQQAYKSWRETAVPDDPHALLLLLEDMPDKLNMVDLHQSVFFPPDYLYEPGLFYVEHGCQYDPINAFTNFCDPRLPNAPELIELPSGSFFVRYFFNQVEEIHPFADNMKPIIKYINWVIRNAPSAAARVVVDILPRYLVAVTKMKRKQFNDWRRRQNPQEVFLPEADLSTSIGQFEQERLAIQAKMQLKLKRASRWSTAGTLSSLLFKVAALLALLIAIRFFVDGNYPATVGVIVLAGLLGFISSFFIRLLDQLLVSPYLRDVAAEVASALNKVEGVSQIPYFIFGHDHAAMSVPLPSSVDSGVKQWYVNTGSWIPVFEDEQRLLREDVQLTFLRLVPERQGFPDCPPDLLQWSAEAKEPIEVRLFED
ncbi:hypothetical protein [Candidatus Leptofilum sp.]|uniref:hypothetical protein n=1 Tax=Candidatus Leptofilum sp. TaxID=3241576 RepID=UPI003B5B5C8F